VTIASGEEQIVPIEPPLPEADAAGSAEALALTLWGD